MAKVRFLVLASVRGIEFELESSVGFGWTGHDLRKILLDRVEVFTDKKNLVEVFLFRFIRNKQNVC